MAIACLRTMLIALMAVLCGTGLVAFVAPRPPWLLVTDDEAFDGPTVFALGNADAAWDAGGDVPLPGRYLTDTAWRQWASRAWPPACARLVVRRVRGRLLQRDRQCRPGPPQITGDAGGSARGIFVADDGKRFIVVWNWSHAGRSAGRDTACYGDTIDGARRDVVLVRSRPEQDWRIAPADAADLPEIDRDLALRTCGNLRAFLRMDADRRYLWELGVDPALARRRGGLVPLTRDPARIADAPNL